MVNLKIILFWDLFMRQKNRLIDRHFLISYFSLNLNKLYKASPKVRKIISFLFYEIECPLNNGSTLQQNLPCFCLAIFEYDLRAGTPWKLKEKAYIFGLKEKAYICSNDMFYVHINGIMNREWKRWMKFKLKKIFWSGREANNAKEHTSIFCRSLKNSLLTYK